MAHDVFISYSSADKPTADATCATLESKGLRCWIAPRDILPGEEWGGAIVRAIANARALVLIFSSRANTSKQIVREVERAVNHGIPVIPLRTENVMPTDSLEYFINTPHWLDAFSPPLQDHLDYLADVLKHIVDGKQSPHTVLSRPVLVFPWRRVALGAIAVAVFLTVGAAVWLGTRFIVAKEEPPSQEQVTLAQHVRQPSPPPPSAPSPAVTSPGDMASLLSQIGTANLSTTRMTVSDVDGIYQVLGCEGLVEARNLIYRGRRLTVPSAERLQAASGSDNERALNEIERANVDAIKSYGHRAGCS